MIHFVQSGVETYWWLPVVVAFAISSLTSTAGVSGAFLLLPFQVSVLGFTGPAVSSTNLVFNIFAIPSGVYRFIREKRMVWPLAAVIILGTIPGVFLGVVLRVRYLPDPRSFKMFVGIILLYLGVRLVSSLRKEKPEKNTGKGQAVLFEVSDVSLTIKRISYTFKGVRYEAGTSGIFLLSLVMGLIGGTYGIGGGSIIAPILVTQFGLPIFTVAGATLLATFLTSVTGVAFYAYAASQFFQTTQAIAPDWLLGAMFGIGGSLGIYVGARVQKYLPGKVIKIFLTVSILFIAAKYILGFFLTMPH